MATPFFIDFLHVKCYITLMSIKNWNQVLKTVGNILIDLGKLSFGSLILGSVIRGGFDPMQTFMFGTALAMVFFIIGIFLVNKVKE